MAPDPRDEEEPEAEGSAGDPQEGGPRGGGSLEASLVLLRRYQKHGDREALNDLFERYRPRLRRIVGIRLRASPDRRFDASDIVQATLLHAMRDLPDFELREDAKLINWLAKVAERQLSDQRRADRALKRDERREVEIDAQGRGLSDPGVGFDLADETSDAADKIEHREMVEIVDGCMSELSESYREVILLREYAGGSWQCVADEMGRESPDAARQLYRRAREALGECVRRRTGESGGI